MSPKSEMRVANCIIVTSVITCALSFVAIYIAYRIRPCCNNIDAGSVSVAVLSILVTILIGWNIYSVIDAKGKIEKLEKSYTQFTTSTNNKIDELKKDSKLLHELIAESRSATSFSLGVANNSMGDSNTVSTTFSNFQDALYYSLESGDGMIKENADKFLLLMETILKNEQARNIFRKHKDDKTMHILQIMDAILLHGNPRFTSEQRIRYAEISKQVKDILKL